MLLFDAGRGAMQRLHQVGVHWKEISGVFLTHFHSDHVVGFPDLWLTGWLFYPGRDRAVQVWGPVGTKNMMDHLSQAFAEDLRIRVKDDKLNPEGAVIVSEEVIDGMVIELNGVEVTAFEVDHGSVRPAFGYRIDYEGHSVVLSGDTRPCENLIKYAAGVDILIHEVASVSSLERAGYSQERIGTILGHHTSPEQAGEIFERTRPKLAIYSHIVRPDASEAEIFKATRKRYTGPVEVGEDLMKISIGDTIVLSRPGTTEADEFPSR